VPELPEVETVARLIRPRLVGRRIRRARVEWTRTLGGVSKARFLRGTEGRGIARVWRRAKYIVMDLEPAGCIVGHLRMTGRMQVRAPDAERSPYARVSFDLDDGSVFEFIDVRKFGRLVLADEPGQVLPALGPEPLSDAFSGEWFRAALRKRKRALKPLLLDQSFVAGLGNIYVDEALFTAKLHPLRRADTVDARATKRLHGAIREILEDAIEREGSSFDRFYRTPEGQPGEYQSQFRVYGRTGNPCRRCGRAIKRIVVGQRGTHICTNCQRKPRT
jgi:formamidopyrimidine-DNA glycosylase